MILINSMESFTLMIFYYVYLDGFEL